MATSLSKTLLSCWRDTITALVVLYLTLLILDGLIDGFVRAFIPLTVIGYVAVINLILYGVWQRRQVRVRSVSSTKA